MKLDNEPFFIRHQLSILLGHFLRHVLGADARNAPRLADLLGNPFDDAMFSRLRDTLSAWLESEAGTAALAETEGLCATLPPDHRHVGRRGAELTQRFLLRIGRFLEVHAARLEDLRRRMVEAKEADRFGLAERLQRDMKRYLDQFLVDLFVRVGLIPTYSFPVDDAMFSRLRDTLGAWLESEAGTAALAEAEGLCATLPPDRRHVGRRGSELTQRFLIRIGRFLEVHAARLGDLCRRMAEAKEADQFGLAERLQRDMKRYLDQFLVDLFVRVGLIPTYSFPVDDVKLEVLSRPDQRGKDRAFQARSDELDLTRDAAYAIAEYAPGAEVVAGGRVWTSAGIARYSGEFEAERPYHLCKTCNHPEIRDFDDQLPSTCTNCGEELPRTTATYLQPKGFVTSAAEPDDATRERAGSVRDQPTRPGW